ncbi:DUF5133 domain-containing protein [Streptomyces sp. NPDC002018]|uniref:DUF5133 domain-containing protein n=1 Tax=Streptomyces sp. NPDC002018 TaxID=3364629 RepID=UPI0036B48845
MLMAHPTILRSLVEQYETLEVLRAEQGSPETRRRLEDVTYTLCVSTGTRTIEDALAVARTQLADALGETAAIPSPMSPDEVRLTV